MRNIFTLLKQRRRRGRLRSQRVLRTPFPLSKTSETSETLSRRVLRTPSLPSKTSDFQDFPDFLLYCLYRPAIHCAMIVSFQDRGLEKFFEDVSLNGIESKQLTFRFVGEDVELLDYEDYH
jgi:hypothetical protein